MKLGGVLGWALAASAAAQSPGELLTPSGWETPVPNCALPHDKTASELLTPESWRELYAGLAKEQRAVGGIFD